MGLFDKFTGNIKKKKKKYAPKSADERLKLTKVRSLSAYLRAHPDAAEQLAIQEFGLGDQEKGKGQIEEIVEQLQILRKGGLIENPRNLGQGGNVLVDVARAFGEGIGTILQAKMDPNAMLGHPTAQQEQPRQVYLPQPQREYAPQIVQRETSQATQQTGESKMDFVTQMKVAYLMGQLDARSPEDAAQWLLAQLDQQPELKPFVGALCNTPDNELSAKAQELAAQYPQAAPVVNWLLSHEDKAKQIVWAMRQHLPQSDTSDAPTASAMGI